MKKIVVALIIIALIAIVAILTYNFVGFTEKKRCESQGGTWGVLGISQEETCNLPTSDSEKTCNDSSECQGKCVASLSAEQEEKLSSGELTVIETQGKCSEEEAVFGCFGLVENGRVNGITCAD